MDDRTPGEQLEDLPECVDAHHHLWEYDSKQYGWMSDRMDVLRRNFLLPELRQIADAEGITGTVVVQARQSLNETKWLLGLADQCDLIQGVVGWVPLTLDGIRDVMSELAPSKSLKGVRHVLHDELDDNYMLRPGFKRGIAALEEFKLRYDLLIMERHLPQTLQLVDEFPNQLFVIDHIAKPLIGSGELEPWAARMRELAKREHVFCKLSGMVTEANWHSWTEAQLAPYFDVVLEAFTPGRLMFGSDWPVLQLASRYGRWIDVVRRAIAKLATNEQRSIMAGSAREFYRL
jgi:L-fuconolactonase